MTTNRLFRVSSILFVTLIASAAVVDRVAVVVGKTVITESEVLQEARLNEFLNGQPLDLGPQVRRTVANRLVDQQLIRNEMEVGNYPKPTAEEGKRVLQNFRQQHYPSDADFQAALNRYGITADQLQQHLMWQTAAVRFAEMRFPNIPDPSGADRQTQADRLAQNGGQVQDGDQAQNGDQQMDAWLKEVRGQTRVQFKQEAFQ